MLIDKKYLDVRERVLNDAGIRNEPILSPHEIDSSKTLLCDYEAALHDLYREIAPLLVQKARIEERLQTFRIAVSPHKQIPVCSLWRRISRNDSELWNNIALKADASSERLFELLPPCASATLVIRGSRPSTVSVTSARNIIPQVRNLEIRLTPVGFEGLFDNLPGDICGKLETLHFYLTSSPENNATPLVLTKALSSMGNLRSLKLGCDKGILRQALSMELPWHQIVSLDISGLERIPIVPISKYIQQFKSLESLTLTLTDHEGITTAGTQLVIQAFRCLPQSLCSLTIKANSYYSSSTSMHLVLKNIQPEAWARLVSLDLTDAQITDNATIEKLLRQCVQLVSFRSTVLRARWSVDVRVRDIVLPHLTSLHFARAEDYWIFECLSVPRLKEIVLAVMCSEEKWRLYTSAVREMIVSSGRSVHSSFTTFKGFTTTLNVVVVAGTSRGV
ncbi:hypothetical protein DXG03_006693 [Asterophora parasitica]|uniref:F-box domain-containing protein n=1 Tax=Asterophora parasitica TaxID=117018 RepID=A0A9P7FYH3_9AGAR|nr:hypothetical protein DXG03_006693 [Asterophora parasitica]